MVLVWEGGGASSDRMSPRCLVDVHETFSVNAREGEAWRCQEPLSEIYFGAGGGGHANAEVSAVELGIMGRVSCHWWF